MINKQLLQQGRIFILYNVQCGETAPLHLGSSDWLRQIQI